MVGVVVESGCAREPVVSVATDGVVVEAPSTAGGVEDVESSVGSVDGLESGVDEAEPLNGGVLVPVVAVESLTTGRAETGGVDWGAGGRIREMGAVLPSETVSCSAGEAKACQANLSADVTGVGTRIVNPIESRSVTNSPEAL